MNIRRNNDDIHDSDGAPDWREEPSVEPGYLEGLEKPRKVEGISGKQLQKYSNIMGYNATQMCNILGITNAQLSRLNKSDTDAFQPRHSVLVRYLLDHVDDSPLQEPPSPIEFYQKLQEIDPSITEAHAALIVGLNSLSFRIYEPDYKPSSVVSAYMLIMANVLDSKKTHAQKMEALKEFAQNAQNEAKARGVPPKVFWEEANWPVSNKRGGTK